MSIPPNLLYRAEGEPASDKPPRRRRWIPWSLRIFVVTLSLLGAAGTWIASRFYQERTSIRAIERLGGKIQTKRTAPAWMCQWPADGLLRIFDEVTLVDLSNLPVTDADLIHLARFTRLEELRLDGTRTTDAGLAHVRELASLEFLALGGTHGVRCGFGPTHAIGTTATPCPRQDASD
ncbi:MAG TPA: hypothetical protein VKU82_13220 [Planctomycetaceae bacterium]|nr:hypothetical protein [Planctomycetaceae bacterium]